MRVALERVRPRLEVDVPGRRAGLGDARCLIDARPEQMEVVGRCLVGDHDRVIPLDDVRDGIPLSVPERDHLTRPDRPVQNHDGAATGRLGRAHPRDGSGGGEEHRGRDHGGTKDTCHAFTP
jgi:hypothetical protein